MYISTFFSEEIARIPGKRKENTFRTLHWAQSSRHSFILGFVTSLLYMGLLLLFMLFMLFTYLTICTIISLYHYYYLNYR